IALARALQEGEEPSEPWHPEGYKFRRSRVVIDGPKEEAIEQAKAKAKTATFDGRHNAPAEAQPIPVPVGGSSSVRPEGNRGIRPEGTQGTESGRAWSSTERLRSQNQQF